MFVAHNLKCRCNVNGSLLLLVLLLLWSCKNTNEESKTDFSITAQKALANADSLVAIGHGKRGIKSLDSIYSTFKNPTAKELFEKYKIKADYYLWPPADTAKVKLLADSMLQVFKGKEKQYKVEYAAAIFIKGDILMAHKNYEQAFKYYYDARQFALKHLDRCDYYSFTYRLGMIMYQQDRYLEAIPYIKQAIAEGDSCKNKEDLTGILQTRQAYLNTLALCYERTGKFDEAIWYYQKTLSFIDTIATKYPKKANFWLSAHGVVYGNMGGVYLKLNNYKAAERYLKQSIAINDRPNFDFIDAQTAKLKLADLYLRISNFKAAAALLTQLQQALEQKTPETEMSANSQLKLYKLQWQYAVQLKLQPQVAVYMQRYYNFRDSLEEVNKNTKAASINIAFKSHEQQYKLALLTKENETKKIYLIGFLIFSATVISVLLLVWRNRQRLKALNSIILDQNADLHEALTALEQSQEENTQIMKVIVHDLRSPMAAAISITSILLKNEKLEPSDSELLKLLETSSINSLEMTNDLLNMNTKLEDLLKEPVEMHSLINHCVNLLKFKAAEKKQQINTDLEEVVLEGNREKLWRVMSNLIVNAIKFSPPGAQIDIKLFKLNEQFVQVMVKDYGIGVPEELREKIFNIFTDAKRRGTSGEQPFGLGLAISKQIVEAHSGRIWLESEVGNGSTFFVELPID